MSSPGRYKTPPLKDIRIILKVLYEEFEEYLQYGLGYNKNQYIISGIDILDAIIRVDKRMDYFSYFHGMGIDNEKKAALFAYWIIKLRPVKLVDTSIKNKKNHTNINEKLAINHLLNALVEKGKIKHWDGASGVKDLDINNKYIKDLTYSFRFRNFTIDSMIILAESINTETLCIL